MSDDHEDDETYAREQASKSAERYIAFIRGGAEIRRFTVDLPTDAAIEAYKERMRELTGLRLTVVGFRYLTSAGEPAMSRVQFEITPPENGVIDGPPAPGV